MLSAFNGEKVLYLCNVQIIKLKADTYPKEKDEKEENDI